MPRSTSPGDTCGVPEDPLRHAGAAPSRHPAVRHHDRLPLPQGTAGLTVRVRREDSYRVHVVPGPAAALRTLRGELAGRRAALITDPVVHRLHGAPLAAALREHGLLAGVTTIAPGERGKQFGTGGRLLDWLAGVGLTRRDVLIALGGGALVDTVGWVAGAYMRGVPYINVPTTLLGQVDAGIGGKVAVNHSSAKNLIGAFYQPHAVISCLAYLDTLDARQLRAGLAEVVKKAVIASPELFAFLEERAEEVLAGTGPHRETVVRAAGAVKSELIARDPYERDLRRPLNFGHTLGHAVETATGHGPVLHGEAVAFGMAAAVRIARAREVLAAGTADRVTGLLGRLGLPVRLPELAVVPEVPRVLAALEKVRQIRDGSLRFVLPEELGTTVIVDDVTEEEILRALDHAGPAGPAPAAGGVPCSAGG
ncbi:3-dehydroquinate synthase family protein [Streptomyces aidingensis]|uniref:2-deoxy-scyllo-inosose synthase n=1 Tax=Streptomyces aidingensis TaxID=910347 RepID=A0A1I1SLT5_9ACTN|nr:3-dehydroquinate synthase family protein [Streptomyces aidingensis]SFD47439.1 3-dehydroquinate synthase [Streptomyces aidingensis]